jgi:hypothetical protein
MKSSRSGSRLGIPDSIQGKVSWWMGCYYVYMMSNMNRYTNVWKKEGGTWLLILSDVGVLFTK